jgi:hypothetical protein
MKRHHATDAQLAAIIWGGLTRAYSGMPSYGELSPINKTILCHIVKEARSHGQLDAQMTDPEFTIGMLNAVLKKKPAKVHAKAKRR